MRRESVIVVAVLVFGYSLYLPPALALADAIDAREPGRTARLTPSNDSANAAEPPLQFETVSAETAPEYTYEQMFKSEMAVISNAGVYAGDYDNDGWEDLLAIGGERPVLFHNDEGTFHRSGELVGVNATARGALFLDYDSDGQEDLLLLAANRTPLLFVNRGGSFEQIDAGFEKRLEMPVSATAGDFDGDGNLDLFVIQYGDWNNHHPIGLRNYSIPRGRDNGNPDYLYRGDGNSFKRVEGAGIMGTHWSLATSAVDLNGDDLLDIHVANDFYYDVIYLNRGDGTFEKRRLGERTNRNGMSSEVADVNRDGRPDLFVTNIWFPDVIGKELTKVNDLRYEGNNLLINRGDGTFDYLADEYGVMKGGWGWAAVIADLDSDMDRDLFHTTFRIPFTRHDSDFTVDQLIQYRMKYPFYRYPVLAERNDTGFTQPTGAPAAGIPESNTRGVARLDFDNDGDLDLAVANASENGAYQLYENRGDQGNAVQLRIVGDDGQPVLGATVRVTTGERIQPRWVTARSDFLSQDSRLLHVGAGNHTRVDVTVTWSDGTTYTAKNVAVGQRLIIAPDGIRRTVNLPEITS